MAFAVAPEAWTEVHAYLTEREMDRGVYLETQRSVTLASGKVVLSLVFVADPKHVQYAGKLDLAAELRLVRDGVGESGRNPDYVKETARHLEALGIRDRHLDELVAALGKEDVPALPGA